MLPATLRWHWWTVALAFAATGLLTYATLHMVWHPSRASTWGIPASAALAYVLGYARLNLQYNRRSEDGPILPHLGMSNALTLVRGLLVALLAGFVVLPLPHGIWAFVPGLLYTAAALTDLADGALARARGESTRLGAKLDVEMDSIGILVAVLIAVQAGQLPPVFIGLGLVYYLYRIAMGVRRKLGFSIQSLPDSIWRKRIGGAWVIFLCVTLYPVYAPPATTLAGTVLGTLLLLSFGRDALVASGCGDRLDFAQPITNRISAPNLLLIFRGIGGSVALMIPIISAQNPSIFSFELEMAIWVGLALWLFIGRKSWVAAGGIIALAGWFLTSQGWEAIHALSVAVSLGVVLLESGINNSG